MNFVRYIAIAGLLLIAAAAQAGTIHPALQAKLDKMPMDEAVSVIVNMAEQAPIDQLSATLHANQASRQERHQKVLEALQTTTRESQNPIKSFLDQEVRHGSVLGYTSYWISNLLVVYATRAEIEQLAARPDVDVIESNFHAEPITPVTWDQEPVLEETSNERGIGVTPGLRAINAPQVWYQLGITGVGAIIGGCDTGVSGTHPALQSRWRGNNGHPWQECWLDLLGTGTSFPVDNGQPSHGTHTMGTMTGLGAATGDTVGVAWGAQWIATNPIDQGVGSGFDNDIITAYQWFADPDGNPGTPDNVPDVVQNSWGINEGFSGNPPYTDCDTRWWAALDNCEAAGVCITWSAGNEGSNPQTLRSPADRATTLTNSFSVGAVDATSYSWPYPIAGWSSRGPSGCNVPADQKIKPEVCAPGVTVYSSLRGGGYGNMDGTSMAGPHVAGVVALMRSANPNLDVDTIKQILMDTAHDEGTSGEDNTYGHGFIDAYAAVVAATVGFGNIQGHVYNASWHGVPIQGATVTLTETGVHFGTDALGFYSGAAMANTYNVQATAPGFSTRSVLLTIVANQTAIQDFSLTDIAGPTISNVTEIGTTTDIVGPYVIGADIADASTVSQAKLFYRLNELAWAETPMALNGTRWEASIGGFPSGTKIDYYVWAQDGVGLSSVNPSGAPNSFYSLYITEIAYAYTAEDPNDPSWQLGMAGDNATSGIWIRDNPVGTTYNEEVVQPEDDHTAAPGVKCFVTGNGAVGGAAGEADVDGGCTTLRSPIFDLSGATQAFATYWRWFGMNGLSTDDQFAVDVSSNGGTTWLALERVPTNAASWVKVVKNLNDYITLTSQVVFRYQACDLNSGGLIEAGIDDFAMETFTPNLSAVPGRNDASDASLAQNEPNPFRPVATPVTSISFRLSNPADARLDIFNAGGQLVRTLIHDQLASGSHSLYWDGLDEQGRSLPSGMYFYHLKAGAFEQSRSLTILR